MTDNTPLSEKQCEYDPHQRGYFEEDIKQALKDFKEECEEVTLAWMSGGCYEPACKEALSKVIKKHFGSLADD